MPGEDVAKILVVDDEVVIREILADFLTMEGLLRAELRKTGAERWSSFRAIASTSSSATSRCPTWGASSLLSAIQKHTPHVVTIIMTGFGTVETAIEAMKQGAPTTTF